MSSSVRSGPAESVVQTLQVMNRHFFYIFTSCVSFMFCSVVPHSNKVWLNEKKSVFPLSFFMFLSHFLKEIGSVNTGHFHLVVRYKFDFQSWTSLGLEILLLFLSLLYDLLSWLLFLIFMFCFVIIMLISGCLGGVNLYINKFYCWLDNEIASSISRAYCLHVRKCDPRVKASIDIGHLVFSIPRVGACDTFSDLIPR